MNVVYRGVKNPMTISFAGVSDNKVHANAQGLTKVQELVNILWMLLESR